MKKKLILEGKFTEFVKKDKFILEGIFTKFSPTSYPGRIYGMYVWDWDRHKWIVDEKFCKENGIDY